MNKTMLCHLVERANWQNRTDEFHYAPPSLASDGFIHLSPLDQVCATANRYYQGRDDLLLLVLDPSRLHSPVRWEDLYGHGSFPHLYGPLNVDAVTTVVPFPCADEGPFILPEEIVHAE